MVNIVVNGTAIYGSADYPITSGTVGRKVRFTFDESWDGLLKIGVFRCGGVEKEIELDNVNECEFPWEVLVHANVGKCIDVGICGLLEDKIVYPTIYTGVGNLLQGTVVTGDTSIPYTPSATEQALTKSEKALKSVEEILQHEELIRLVETHDELDALEPEVNLAFVRTNRGKFNPVTLEVGEQYGGIGSVYPREHLFIDPLLVDFFPCEPFVVTTEPTNGFYHEFATDGSTWFTIKSFNDTRCYQYLIYNNTENPITIDGITCPFTGWQEYEDATEYNPARVFEHDPYTDPMMHLYFSLINVKFTSDEHFEDLEKILSLTYIYSSRYRGLYHRDYYGWNRIDAGDIKLGLQAVTEQSHTHTVSDDEVGNVTINLATNKGGGDIGGGIIGGNGDLELQSAYDEPMREMKTLTIDDSTYEIVDDKARQKLSTLEDSNGGIYVGTGDMPDDCNVQIDPDGDVAVIPTKTSELENDSGFITNDKIDLTDKPFDDTDVSIELPADTSNCTMISSQPIQSVGGIPVTFIKVSESVFKTAEDIIDVVIKVNYEATGAVGDFTAESKHIHDLGNGFGVIGYSKSVDGEFPFFMDIHTIGTVTLPTTEMEDFSEDAVYNVQETGLYFLYMDGMAKTLSCEKDNPTKLEPNIYYSFGEVATLALEFSEGDSTKVNEYMFSFISGETATVLTLPSSVQWVNELTVEANKRYEISVVDNIGLWCAVEAVSE